MNFYKEFSKKFFKLSKSLKFKSRNYSGKETLKESTKFEKTLQKWTRNLKEFTKFNPNITALVSVIIGAITMRFLFETKITQILKEMKETQIREKAKKFLLEPVQFVEELDYVERKEIEERLNHLVGNLNQEKYVIIIGSKGSGKTTLLKHVLNGKKGIVFENFGGETTLENLGKKLLAAINVQIEPWNQSNFFK
jgi:flagellar biosynthesis GTPase FlhF